MNTAESEYPKPIWRRRTDGTVEIKYANNRMQYILHLQAGAKQGDLDVPEHGYGWSGNYIHQAFPSVVHGPNGQSLSVKNQAEKDRALASGWSLRPVGTEVDPSLGPVTSPDQAPHDFAEEVEEKPKRSHKAKQLQTA